MNLQSDLIACYVARQDEAGTSHEFLQCRRTGLEYMGGTWQTIFGAIEAGETAWQAALRELYEETELRPKDFYRVGIVSQFYIPGETAADDRLEYMVPFLAIVERDVRIVLNDEHDDYRWVHRESIRHFMWPADHEALRVICDIILDRGLAAEHLRIATE